MNDNHSQIPQRKSFSQLEGLGFAYRLGIEFISGILVGLLLGYGIDNLFGTKPWGLVIMVLLGAVASLLTVFRLLGLSNGLFSRSATQPIGKKKDG